MRRFPLPSAVCLVLVAACWLSISPCPAKDYYLSPGGHDAGPGTREQPWQTIGKANAAVQPGDVVVFLPGTYEGTIRPEQSGRSDAPIVYRSESYRKATLEAPADGMAIHLPGKSHVRVEGFRVTADRGRWLAAHQSHHLAIQGCYMERASRDLRLTECDQVRLVDNVFAMDKVSGNMCCIVVCSHVLIEGNSFTKVGHSPLQITTCRNVVVRANCFRNNWGRNYEFWASGKVLVEGNLVTQARDSAHSADSRAKNLYTDSIYRFNRAFRNLHTPLNSLSYFPSGGKPTTYFREPFRLMNTRVYHNTVTNNIGHGWELGGLDISANEFANNVFFMNDRLSGGVQLYVSDQISKDNRFRFNLFGAAERGRHVILYGRDRYWTADEANKKTPAHQGFWSEFEGNIDADPAYVDMANNDFRLKPGSPCIDAGIPLTIALGKGKGRELPVSDCRYFFDGFGIEGEEGDWVAVGKGDNIAQVRKVEFRYCQPGILHLDREVEWTNGMPVGLPWAGKAPDTGAFEHGGHHPTRLIAVASPFNPEPGRPVSFKLDTLGKKAKTVQWDFGDAAGGRSTDVSPTYTYPNAGTYGVTARAEFENGKRGIDVVLVKVEPPHDPKAPLVKCDFEDATREAEWGHHFKFYRRWLSGYEYVKREPGGGKCVHLFRDNKKACRAAGAVAPGEWDIDAYPFIRFAYRIAKGVPVSLCFEPFPGEKVPLGVVLGGTASRVVKPYIGVDAYTLIDDDQWHDITIDVRKVREGIKDLKYLRRFLFYANWRKDEGQEFWFDDFAVLPE